MRQSNLAQRGITILEIVIVLGMLAILLSIGAMNFRPPAERTAANAAQAFVQQSRFDAIKTNRPVVVAVDSQSGELTAARLGDSTSTACAGAGQPSRRLSFSEYPGVSVTNTDFAVLWLPTGQPRTCPTGATPLNVDQGASLLLAGRNDSLTLVVGAGGEVGIQ